MSVTLRVGIERNSSQNDNTGAGSDISSMTEEHAKAFFDEIKEILSTAQWNSLKSRIVSPETRGYQESLFDFQSLITFM